MGADMDYLVAETIESALDLLAEREASAAPAKPSPGGRPP
jgi:hypothetical protein